MLKLTLFLLCLGVGTSLAVSFNDLLHNTELNLLRLMMDTRLDQRANPERSLDCFDYYLQLFDDISKEYKESYAACLAAADEDRKQIDASTQPERDAIEESARSTCVALKVCSGHRGSIDYFNCFANSGKENTATMYEISANASEKLSEVRESYRLIENDEYRCTNSSERVYVEQTYQANLNLQSCLKGETPVPTTTPKSSTDAPGTTVAPGHEPDTTTASVGPTTKSPETTAASKETTTDEADTTTSSGEPTTVDPNTTATSEDTSTSEPTTDTTASGSSESSSSESSSSSSSESSSSSSSESSSSSSSESSSSSSSESSSSSSSSSESDEDLLPEEDLFAIGRNRLAKIRAALGKH